MARVETTGTFEATVDLDGRSVKLDKTCIGAEVRFQFKNEQLALCFPNFDPKRADMFDHPLPTFAGTGVKLDWLKRHKPFDGVSYGSEKKRSGDEVLEFSCNQIVIRSINLITARKARLLRQSLPLWLDVVSAWLETLAYTDLEHDGTTVSQIKSAESYFFAEGEKPRAVNGKAGATIAVNIENAITKQQLTKALEAGEKGQPPATPYLILIQALKHLHQQDYRQCILDSATALEITLTQLLERELASLTLIQRRLILDKYDGIMRLYGALKKLGVDLPTQNELQAKVATPRNAAIHTGASISGTQAKESLDFVKTLIYDRITP